MDLPYQRSINIIIIWILTLLIGVRVPVNSFQIYDILLNNIDKKRVSFEAIQNITIMIITLVSKPYALFEM